VLEASGVYEGVVAAALAESRVAGSDRQPARVRKFAGAVGETAQPAGGGGEVGSSRPRLTVR